MAALRVGLIFAFWLVSTVCQASIVTVSGTISTVSAYYASFSDGIDHAGIFGVPGASLEGQFFTAVWTSARDQGFLDAVLTVNGRSFDFGLVSGVSGIVRSDYQTLSAPGGYLSMTSYTSDHDQTGLGIGGGFRIPAPGFIALPTLGASGYFLVTALAVVEDTLPLRHNPAPVLSLAFAPVILLGWFVVRSFPRDLRKKQLTGRWPSR